MNNPNTSASSPQDKETRAIMDPNRVSPSCDSHQQSPILFPSGECATCAHAQFGDQLNVSADCKFLGKDGDIIFPTREEFDNMSKADWEHFKYVLEHTNEGLWDI
ncbi:hypothetical protein QSH57_004388 [Fusarium oxysporum f. sp. vasinfectum]|nr:hypothetical protein QSH57_004388 [Fusarium oxysporum f. sp. vasinfectum]